MTEQQEIYVNMLLRGNYILIHNDEKPHHSTTELIALLYYYLYMLIYEDWRLFDFSLDPIYTGEKS